MPTSSVIWPEGVEVPVGQAVALRVIVHVVDIAELRAPSGGAKVPTVRAEILEAEIVE